MEHECRPATGRLSSRDKETVMSDPSVFSRISHWFKPSSSETAAAAELPLERDGALVEDAVDGGQPVTVTTFLKPWAKREATLTQLQEGFASLNDLVAAVRDNLDRQAERHDELLRVLRHLPDALRAIPETARTQAETLKVVGEQLQRHNGQYHRLAEVLEKVAESGAGQRKLLDVLGDRVETISQHDRSMVDHMRSVSAAMQGVSQNTQTSAQVLDQLKENARTRDVELQVMLHRQGVRFTIMLSAAIVLSLSALAAVGVLGWRFLK
jgi:methyl-accepting chemotaxis protein